MKLQLQSAGLWRRVVAILLFGAFALAVFAALTRQGARVADVVIDIRPTAEGSSLIETKDVQARLDSGPHGVLVGQTINTLALEQLEQFLEADPFVADADIYTFFDGKLHVSIIQAQPILRVHHRRSADYYIGADGAVLPMSKNGVVRVPILTGKVPTFVDAVRDTVLQEGYVLAKALAVDPLYAGLIEQISRDGDGYLLVPKMGRARYRLGTLNDLERKLSRLTEFLRTVTPEVGWEHYREIDLRYDGQVVARRARQAAKLVRP